MAQASDSYQSSSGPYWYHYKHPPKLPPMKPAKPANAGAPRPATAKTPTVANSPTPPSYYPSGGGGGGGGGGGAPAPAAPYAGLPEQYIAGLMQFVGDPAAYYGTRGAEKQAQQDFYTFGNTWQARTGRTITPDDWAPVWGMVNAYKTGQVAGGRPSMTMSDAFAYLGRLLTKAPKPIPVSYLKVAEV
jgi:hypothetical protein